MTVHRYWRFNPIQTAGSNVGASEVALRATVGGAAQIPVNGVVASNTLSGAAAQLIDGITNTGGWTGTTYNAVLTYDYGATPIDVGEIAISDGDGVGGGGYANGPNYFVLENSDDNVTWATAFSGYNGTAWTSGETRTFTPPPPATAITLTGPSGGNVNQASTAFTVGANGVITGNVVVTPTDSSAAGTFSPTSVTINSTTTTATFTYTPTTGGARNINCTNDGTLTAPANVVYTSVAYATTAAVTIKSAAGVAAASLQSLKWAFYDQVTPDLFAAPVAKGAAGATDVNGAFSATITGTALAPAGVGWLVVTDSTGAVTFAHKAFCGPVAAS